MTRPTSRPHPHSPPPPSWWGRRRRGEEEEEGERAESIFRSLGSEVTPPPIFGSKNKIGRTKTREGNLLIFWGLDFDLHRVAPCSVEFTQPWS